MPAYDFDQLNRKIILPNPPKRIISTVPSQTELLFYLGFDEEIIGITKFCIHPHDQVKNKTKIGGTKQLNVDLIRKLKPDLIIANKEENERSQVEELATICPIWISDVSDLTDALKMIESLGTITGRQKEAIRLVNAINISFNKLIPAKIQLNVVYLIWHKPYMVAGLNTFINSMLKLCGFTNAFNVDRYPAIDEFMLRNANPDVVMLSSEPYPFGNIHIAEIQAILPEAKVILVDGELFSWYGSRLLKSAAYFNSLIKLLADNKV